MVLTIAELNLDVLREICSCMTAVKDVLSFSRTCSAFRPIAVARLLGMPIDLRREIILRNIYNFVSVDKGQRGRYIRDISIPFNILREDLSKKLNLAEHFLALLSCATCLCKLSLYVPVPPEQLFTTHPSVLPDVAGLTTSLQELELTVSTEVASLLLGSTCSALKVFRYQCPYEYEGSRSSRSLSISMAPQLASTLEEIQVPSDFVPIAARSYATFPAVRSLTLTEGTQGNEVFSWHMNELLALFPNLDRTFIIEEDPPQEHAYDVVSTSPSDDLVALRAKNSGAQNSRTWTGLNRVSILSNDGLYALSLACPVRHLTLSLHFIGWKERPELEAQSTSRVRTILEDCTPSHLHLIYTLHLTRRTSLSPDWDKLFAENVIAKLTHLVLSVDYYHESDVAAMLANAYLGRGKEIERPWPAILDSLLSGPSALHSLTHVRIVVFAQLIYIEKRSFLAVMHNSLSSFKFDRILDVIPRSIPSLLYIAITSRGSAAQTSIKWKEAWEVNRAWRVRRNAAARCAGAEIIEELCVAEAEAMNEMEELNETEIYDWGDAPANWGFKESYYSGSKDSEGGDSEEGDLGNDGNDLTPDDQSTSDGEAAA